MNLNVTIKVVLCNFFSVTLDYKSLSLLAVKKDDEDFELGGQGLDVEFCIFCTAIRVSSSYTQKQNNMYCHRYHHLH